MEGDPRWAGYVKAFVAVVLLLFAGGIATNMVVNPRGEFPHQWLPPVPSEDAAYKTYLLDRQPPPEVLVLGSSRMQKIDPQDIQRSGNLTAFNFAVAGTQPADSLRVYRGLVQRGYHPKEILVGLDINRIEPHEDEHRTQAAFGPLHEDAAGLRDQVMAGLRTFTFQYLRDSATSLYFALEGPRPIGITFDEDGLAHFRAWEEAEANGSFDLDKSLAAAIGAGGYLPYGGLDPVQVTALQELTARALANGTTVRMVITPIHARLEQSYGVSGYPQARQAVVDLARSLCQPGVHAFNYTRVAGFGGLEGGFFDGVHYNAANAARLVEGVYSGRGDLCA